MFVVQYYQHNKIKPLLRGPFSTKELAEKYLEKWGWKKVEKYGYWQKVVKFGPDFGTAQMAFVRKLRSPR